MRRFAGYLWPSMALLLAACSFVTDFPKERLAESPSKPGLDASMPQRDAGERDSGRDAQPAPDAETRACDLSTHEGCEPDQLCCPTAGSPTCIPVSSGDCSACGAACSDQSAPFCSDRTKGCECEVGTGEGCAANETCVRDGGKSRCVECETDDDCTGASKHCVQNRCRMCDRGSDLTDARDDKGCSGATPICGASNTCEACTATPNNCAAGQTCTPAFGCFGCTKSVGVGANGCSSPTTPVCASTSVSGETQMQCSACKLNTDCAPLLYCDSRSGACTNVCDPDNTDENDGCMGSKSICKATERGGFECRACSPSDCSGAKPHCATAGDKAGQCVTCRSDGDCRSGTAPICDRTSFECRPLTQADCTGTSKPFLVAGQCVECTAASDCTKPGAAGPVCASNTCGECGSNAECESAAEPVCNTLISPTACVAGCSSDAQCASQPATPLCDPARGVCVACRTDAQCTTPTAPVCVDGACGPCTSGGPTADAKCAAKSTSAPYCVRSGALAGRCGECDPGSMASQKGCVLPEPRFCSPATATCLECDLASERGCEDNLPRLQCVKGAAEVPGCFPCDPDLASSCPAGSTCVGPDYKCVSTMVPDAGSAGDAGVADSGVTDAATASDTGVGDATL